MIVAVIRQYESMRRLKEKLLHKELRLVPVPTGLRECMADTFSLYDGGWDDLPYIDDCLQGMLVGGKVQNHKKPYRFTYREGAGTGSLHLIIPKLKILAME